MEIVRFASLIYRSTKIPASHVALLSSIQVNDRADVALLGASGFSLMSSPAPRSGLSRSDFVLWPTADQRVHRGMSATGKSRHQSPDQHHIRHHIGHDMRHVVLTCGGWSEFH